MTYTYKTQGVCASKIDFELNDGIVSGIKFTGGCNGNLKAIAKLCEGKAAKEVAEILMGNECGSKPTSCGDQLAKALTAALEDANK